MNPSSSNINETASPDERLTEALLREHARAGSGADEAFLARLETALDAETAAPVAPVTEPARKGPRRYLVPLALAASVVLAGGLAWPFMKGRPVDSYRSPNPVAAKPPLKESGGDPPDRSNPTDHPALPGKTPATAFVPPQPSDVNPWVGPSEKPLAPSDPGPMLANPGPLVAEGMAKLKEREQAAGTAGAGNGLLANRGGSFGDKSSLSGLGGGGSGGFGFGKGSGSGVGRGVTMFGFPGKDYAFNDSLRSGDRLVAGEEIGGYIGGQPAPVDRERYGQLVDNPWQTPVDAPLSTFSIDVDTASYSNFRRLIQDGARIPADSVRLEEMVNYFDYGYTPPTGEHPFAVHVANASCPWNPDHQLVRVALKGREIERTERAPANLVFLLDVSGSMDEPRKLPLVAKSFDLLIEELKPSDTLSIVVYAGAEGLALPPTSCDADGRKKIAKALRNLKAGGSTNGGAGIRLAYQLAKDHFKQGGINRVILATDGDFNVGVTEDGGLVRLVEENAKSKVFLTVLGYGTGNLNDGMLEAITNKGNGTYYYIDGIEEARRVFLQKMMGTLVTIAKDVKIQVEFNPAQVRKYRLLGYANRMLKKEDFSNDKVDAGDIGAGHTVTAFYEIETGDGRHLPPAETLRYQANPPGETATAAPAPAEASREWLTVKLRYKQPEGDTSTLMENPYTGAVRSFNEAEADFRFATAVSLTGSLLRETKGLGQADFATAREWARGAIGSDPHGLRAEFVKLLDRLVRQQSTEPKTSRRSED